MIVIGVCGASGSGKSTLSEEIKAALREETVIIGQDWYYKDHSDLPFAERAQINYDAPTAFDYDGLYRDLCDLREGKAVTKKGYDYARHLRADTDQLLQPPRVLILEGIHIFYDKRLRDLMHLKVYMMVDVDVCLLRRIQRDIKERAREIDGIAHQYLATVKPMYELHVSKYIKLCDFAVMRGGKNRPSIEAIAAYVETLLKQDPSAPPRTFEE